MPNGPCKWVCLAGESGLFHRKESRDEFFSSTTSNLDINGAPKLEMRQIAVSPGEPIFIMVKVVGEQFKIAHILNWICIEDLVVALLIDDLALSFFTKVPDVGTRLNVAASPCDTEIVANEVHFLSEPCNRDFVVFSQFWIDVRNSWNLDIG